MASLADVILEESSELTGNSEAARAALTEAVTQPVEQTNTNTNGGSTSEQHTENLPDKFRGKSIKEVVDMYQNLEQSNGRMANDLGVQRQLTDRLLGLKRDEDLRANDPSRKQKPQSKPVTTNDLLDRPQETLERVVTERVSDVESNVNGRIQALENELARARFETKHRDYQQTVQDPAFLDWVKASPLRLRAAAAANSGNWGIADELLTEYSGTRQQTQTTTRSEQSESNLDEARRATFTSGGNSSGSDGKPKAAGKVYKRSDLMKLRIEDPDAYYDETFQSEILRAHAEGRVK